MDKKFVLKMNGYDYLDELIDEAWLFLLVHDSHVEKDEWGWHCIDPCGCWQICHGGHPKSIAMEIAAVFIYLFLNGIQVPLAEELARRTVTTYREDKKKYGPLTWIL